MKLNRTQQWIRDQDEGALIYDGLDAAVIGMGHRSGQPPTVVMLGMPGVRRSWRQVGR